MGSRDFGFIIIRNMSAYQQNGNPVPQNQLIATSRIGEVSFTNNLNISTISIHTEFASSINTNGSSATVFISSTNRINTCGYFGGSFNIGSNNSYISFRLLLPVTITT